MGINTDKWIKKNKQIKEEEWNRRYNRNMRKKGKRTGVVRQWNINNRNKNKGRTGRVRL